MSYRLDAPNDIDQAEAREPCPHPLHWRAPWIGVVGDGECRLCLASAQTIVRERLQAIEAGTVKASKDVDATELFNRR